MKVPKKQIGGLPPHVYQTVSVSNLQRVLASIDAGENLYAAAGIVLGDQGGEYIVAAVKRIMALSIVLRGDLKGRSASDVAAAATCQCSAPWSMPGKPRFNPVELQGQQLLMMPIAGVA